MKKCIALIVSITFIQLCSMQKTAPPRQLMIGESKGSIHALAHHHKIKRAKKEALELKNEKSSCCSPIKCIAATACMSGLMVSVLDCMGIRFYRGHSIWTDQI